MFLNLHFNNAKLVSFKVQGTTNCMNGCSSMKNYEKAFSKFCLQLLIFCVMYIFIESLRTPVWLHHNYTTSPKSDPWLVDLEWSKIDGTNFYVVEYTENENFEESDHNVEVINYILQVSRTFYAVLYFKIYTTTKAKFKKPKLCPVYHFRVFAVNENTLSDPSEIVTISG